MKSVFILTLALLALGPARAFGDPDGGPEPEPIGTGFAIGPAIGWFEQAGLGSSAAGAALASAREQLASRPVDWIGFEQLLDGLRQRDRVAGLLAEAQAAFARAVAILESGFVRYYSPGILAEPLLQLGVAQFQAGELDQAHKTFMRVAAMAPRLQPAEGYYSPSVRRAYQEAQRDLGRLTPGVPAPDELGRICKAAGIQGLVVASSERLGDRPLLRLGLFDSAQVAFLAVETSLVDPASAGQSGRELGIRLGARLVEGYGLRAAPDAGPDQPAGQAADAGAPDAGLPADDQRPDGVGLDAGLLALGDEPPPVDPWYLRHWWVWPLAAAVVAAVAVSLPLTVFREDVVDVQVRY